MILLAFGTRPEAIKMGPIAACLTERKVPWIGLCTGQHTDLLRGTPADTDLRRSESLNLPSDGNVLRWLSTCEKAAHQWLLAHPNIGLVVIQGDTMSALAVARAAGGRSLAHVEAGVRSGDTHNPWPEEETRIAITKLVDWHYAPTSTAYANLVSEGIPLSQIRMTGNPIVSALARYTVATSSPSMGHVVVTLHRREFVQSANFKETINTLLNAMAWHGGIEFYWPMHPAVKQAIGELESIPKNLLLSAPWDYATAARMLATAKGTITDSGGIQEEAATLGVPCAVVRHVTDRPESIEAGTARLFPPTSDGVVAAVQCIAAETLPRSPTAVFGTPDSALQIALHLEEVHSRMMWTTSASVDLG